MKFYPEGQVTRWKGIQRKRPLLGKFCFGQVGLDVPVGHGGTSVNLRLGTRLRIEIGESRK